MDNCKNCGAEISPRAKVCPHCGMSQRAQADNQFEQTQKFFSEEDQLEDDNCNAQLLNEGYDNQSSSIYKNQPSDNYTDQTYKRNNNQSSNNYNDQASGYGYNMDNASWYNQPSNNYNDQASGYGYNMDNASWYNQPSNNYNDQASGYGYNMDNASWYNQPSNNYNDQASGDGYNMDNVARYDMDQRPVPRSIGGMIALSIVAFFFFTIGGIVTLVKTMNINKAMTYAEQQARYASAKMWGIASIAIGIVLIILTLI